jgi:O-antigen/teichoic acid export membrane protein
MVRMSILSGAAAGMIGTALGPWFVSRALGDRFLAAGELLGPALWLLAPYGAAMAANPVMIAKGRHLASAGQAGIGAAAMTLTAVFFGGRYGLEGLLACAGFGMLVWAAAQTAALKVLFGLELTKAVVRPMAACLLAIAVYYGSSLLWPMAALPGGLTALIVGVAAFGVISPAERAAARNRLGWRR